VKTSFGNRERLCFRSSDRKSNFFFRPDKF
jgi:hypothetical protein